MNESINNSYIMKNDWILKHIPNFFCNTPVFTFEGIWGSGPLLFRFLSLLAYMINTLLVLWTLKQINIYICVIYFHEALSKKIFFHIQTYRPSNSLQRQCCRFRRRWTFFEQDFHLGNTDFVRNYCLHDVLCLLYT